MNISNKFLPLLLLFSFSTITAYSSEYSKIDEKVLLNASDSDISSDKVMIYSGVRDKTIQLAMNTRFDRIENMMFVNTVYEPNTDIESYEHDEDCD